MAIWSWWPTWICGCTEMSLPTELGVSDLLVGGSDAARLDRLRSEGLYDADGLQWLIGQAQELIHDDPQATETLCRLLDRAADELGLADISAEVRYLQARIVTERGDLDHGLSLIGEARQAWLRAGQPTAALRTELGRMQILDDLGRHGDALEVGQQLVAEVEAIGPEAADYPLARAIRAHAIDNIGTAYGLLGFHEQALLAYAQAEAEYAELGLMLYAARPQASRGVELLALGRSREALPELDAAVEGFTRAGDRLYAAKCQGFQAHAYSQLGQWVEALDVLSRARRTLEELNASIEAVRLQLAMAETYLAVGLWTEARSEAAEAVERTTAGGLVHDAGVACYLLGAAELGAERADQASAALSRAAELFNRVEDRQYAARTRQLQAEAAAVTGREIEARMLAEQAATELAAGGWLVPLVLTRFRLAELAATREQAAAELQSAAELVEQLGLPQLRYPLLVGQARLARGDGRLDEAERLLRGAIDELDRFARALPDHAVRTAYRADRLAAYDDLVAVLLDRGAPGDEHRAREVAGAAKAATLRELIADSVGTAPVAGQPGSELAATYADLAATYRALEGADTPARRTLMVQQAERLEERVSVLRLREAVTPDVADPATRPASSVPTEPGSAELELHVAGEDLVLFGSNGPDRSAVRVRGVLPAVATLLDRLGDQWTRFLLGSVFSLRHSDLLLRTAQTVLQQLYDVLLGPVAEQLTGDAELRIVPHRLLHQVPFGALYDGERYLIERRPVTVLPSPSARGSARPDPPDLGTALVVAYADEAAPAVQPEADMVADLLPTADRLTGEAATGDAFVAAAPRHGLVHLACHGQFRRSNPLFSRLRFADRWLTGAEVLPLDLAGALVVLSACESGQLGEAAEPVGLGWAFLAAGASGVVVSQWRVQDEATRELMGTFYRALVAGVPPAYALRSAQLGTAARHPHPFYWAPFSYLASPAPTHPTVPNP